MEWNFFKSAQRLSPRDIWLRKLMKLEFQWQRWLSHLVPTLLNIWVEVLNLCLWLSHNHALNILISEISVAHVHLKTLELLVNSGHYIQYF